MGDWNAGGAGEVSRNRIKPGILYRIPHWFEFFSSTPHYYAEKLKHRLPQTSTRSPHSIVDNTAPQRQGGLL